MLILSLCLKQHKQFLLHTEYLKSPLVPHHCPLTSTESRLSLHNQMSPLMLDLGNGRRDRGHEKPHPGRRKIPESPSGRPLSCSRLRMLVVVPKSRVRPPSIVTLSPSRGWWPAGQLESSSHRPHNWRASWRERDPEKFKAHPFPAFKKPLCSENSGGDDRAASSVAMASPPPCSGQADCQRDPVLGKGIEGYWHWRGSWPSGMPVIILEFPLVSFWSGK